MLKFPAQNIGIILRELRTQDPTFNESSYSVNKAFISVSVSCLWNKGKKIKHTRDPKIY